MCEQAAQKRHRVQTERLSLPGTEADAKLRFPARLDRRVTPTLGQRTLSPGDANLGDERQSSQGRRLTLVALTRRFPASQPRQHCEGWPRQAGGQMGNRQLALELDQDGGKPRRRWDPSSREVPAGTESRSRFQQLFHAEGRPDLHPRLGHLRSVISKPMGGPPWHQDRFAWTGPNGLATETKTYPAGDHGESLLLRRMGVAGRDMTAWRQVEVEDETFAPIAVPALANDDALAAGRVLDHPRSLISHDFQFGPKYSKEERTGTEPILSQRGSDDVARGET